MSSEDAPGSSSASPFLEPATDVGPEDLDPTAADRNGFEPSFVERIRGDRSTDARPRPVQASRARIVDELVLDEVEPGTVDRLFVELIADGLASGVRVPVMVAKGASPGPVFGLTAAVHGNELNGILVIQRLFRELDPQQLRGTVVGVIAANVPGLQNHQRTFPDGMDLNRIMPGRADGSMAQVYAHRLLHRIVRCFDSLLDLHTASFGRVNSLYVRADLNDARTARMAVLQHPQIIVHNPAGDNTLRGAAMALGIPAITVEIGDPQRFQNAFIEAAFGGVLRVLHWAGLVEHESPDPHDPPVICRSSRWMYTDRGGLLEVYPDLVQPVRQGERVARVLNAFGDPIREYFSEHDGIVVGKSANPVGYTGSRIVHLGRVVDPSHFATLC